MPTTTASVREHHLEVGQLEGHAHAEHHDAQKDVHVAGLHDCGHGSGKDQGDNRDGKRDDRHVLSREVADLGKRLHGEFLSRR